LSQCFFFKLGGWVIKAFIRGLAATKPEFRVQAWQRRLCQSKDPNARIHETNFAKQTEARGMAIGFLLKI
jgi:hypothetical protein